MNSYSKGQRGIAGEHLYSHFLEAGHKGIEDMRVNIIDKMLADLGDGGGNISWYGGSSHIWKPCSSYSRGQRKVP